MSRDLYVEEYKQRFVGLYDRNSDKFRDDLDMLLMMAQSAGALRERYKILDLVRTKRINFAVDSSLDNYKLLSPRIAEMLERELGTESAAQSEKGTENNGHK